MEKETGGPAFPYGTAYTGMTLRDYFAAKAMQATIASWIAKGEYPDTDLEVAENAYVVADAMLKARLI